MVWPFTKKEAPPERLEATSATGLDSDDLLQLFRAFDSIGVHATSAHDKSQLAATAASQLVSSVENASTERALFSTTALFLMITSNHLSRCLGASFEAVSTMALMHYFGPKATDEIESAIDQYNMFTQYQAKLVANIGSAVADWCRKPGDEALQGLAKRYTALNKAFAEVNPP